MLALIHVTWHTRRDVRETNSVPAAVKYDKEYFWHVHTDCRTCRITNQCFIYPQIIRCTCCVVTAAIRMTPSGCAKSHHYMHEDKLFLQNQNVHFITYVTQCRSGLRHWATSRKAARSISDRVIGIYHWYNPSGRTMALGGRLSLEQKGVPVEFHGG